MSHFTSIKTQIRRVDTLVKALADLGFSQVEVHETAQPLYGYQGDRRPETAEVIIRRQHLGALSNDIGFCRLADGTLEAIISEYDSIQYSQPWLNQLTQRYAYHTLMATVQEQSLTLETEELLSDGTVRVVVGKWV
ncbi:MAG: DUF1257 domain-containing protein [Leptolyngbyaceae bacterium]|nr:DUF1257 domain-containing protein [Leptolyngbyaceae bacterium]